jgi:PHS family inorganic phosphate transporter-like MFS transporter
VQIGDKLGRKRVYGMTLLLMVLAALACGLSLGHTATSVRATLCFFRFWLGFGIGGDYPLSATIMSEYANTRYPIHSEYERKSNNVGN